MTHVHYHYPGSEQFSLDFVHPDPAEVVSRIVGYEDEVAVKVSEYDLDSVLYVVYTSRAGGEAVSDMEFDLDDALAEMEPQDGTIVARLLEIYQAVVAVNETEAGTPVEAYKEADVDALPAALDRTSWEGSATEVAGRLASNLILKHALPNANHRTAIAAIQFYLRRIATGFSIPETSLGLHSHTYDWREWVNEYIDESKRLLTVRRKNVRLKHLRDHGATTLERKHGVRLDLTEYELDLYPSEANEIYAREHERLWIEFVEEAVERAGHPELSDTAGLSKAAFAKRIRALD